MSFDPFYLQGTKPNVITTTHIREFIKYNPELTPFLEKYSIELNPLDISDFESFCYWIISQQISGKVAEMFIARLRNTLPEITPGSVKSLNITQFREIGLSHTKIKTLYRLSDFFENPENRIQNHLSSHKIRSHYNQIKGIGPWSVNMHLIFTVGRLDVIAVKDLVVRKGIMRLYESRIQNILDKVENRKVISKTGVITESVAHELTKDWGDLGTIGTLLSWKIMESD